MLENRLHKRHPLVQFVLDNWFYIALAILMWRLPHLLGNYFDQEIQPRRPQGNQPIFWMGVFIQLYILAILAMSYNLIFGFGGIISFGHALFFGTGVYLVAILMEEFRYNIEISAAVALAAATLIGLITALAVFRIRGVYFAMFTLALAQIFHDLVRVNLFKFLTQGDDGRTISDLPDWINPVTNRLSFYYICALLAVLTFVFIRRLINSPTGRVIVAIRENEERAQTMGYNIALYKALVVVTGGTLGAMAGVLNVLFTRQAEPTALGITRTIDPLFMTIIGGIGTNPGPVVGSVILHLGETFFRKSELHIDLNFILFRYQDTLDTVEIWRMILGAVFVLIVLFIPQGVVGQLNMVWIQIRHWLRRFVYNPILRKNPTLAARMETLTGEPPDYALALAETTAGASLIGWAREFPLQAAYAAAGLIAVLGTVVTWDIHSGIALVLFFGLFLVPVSFALWLANNYRRIPERITALLERLS